MPSSSPPAGRSMLVFFFSSLLRALEAERAVSSVLTNYLRPVGPWTFSDPTARRMLAPPCCHRVRRTAHDRPINWLPRQPGIFTPAPGRGNDWEQAPPKVPSHFLPCPVRRPLPSALHPGDRSTAKAREKKKTSPPTPMSFPTPAADMSATDTDGTQPPPAKRARKSTVGHNASFFTHRPDPPASPQPPPPPPHRPRN